MQQNSMNISRIVVAAAEIVLYATFFLLLFLLFLILLFSSSRRYKIAKRHEEFIAKIVMLWERRKNKLI